MRSFHIHTFGCQMNVHDSERVHDLLQAAGLDPVENAESADLVILNTCSVREKAEQKLDSELGKLRLLKERRNPRPVIAVIGCVAQQRGNAMLARMPFVDIVLGPDNLRDLPTLARDASRGSKPVARTLFDMDAPTFLSARPKGQSSGGPSAFVAIAKGCDERCSFCIVPSTRGPERHRSAVAIVDEISNLVDNATREVILLGQTVNGYRDATGVVSDAFPLSNPGSGDTDFAGLLRLIARRVPSLDRLRYTSPHPRYYGPSVVAAHQDLDVLCRHVHMPVQSGSDAILRRMVRRHTRTEYLATIEELRKARSDLTVSTDIIVGFPGETDEDFDQTISLMREAHFTGTYAFKYSRRPGTPALRLSDDVPEEVKAERLARVFEVSEEIQAIHLSSLVNTTQRVLVEELSARDDGKASGHTDRNEIVHIVDGQQAVAIGEIVSVKILRAFRHSLEGELASIGQHRHLPVVA